MSKTAVVQYGIPRAHRKAYAAHKLFLAKNSARLVNDKNKFVSGLEYLGQRKGIGNALSGFGGIASAVDAVATVGYGEINRRQLVDVKKTTKAIKKDTKDIKKATVKIDRKGTANLIVGTVGAGVVAICVINERIAKLKKIKAGCALYENMFNRYIHDAQVRVDKLMLKNIGIDISGFAEFIGTDFLRENGIPFERRYDLVMKYMNVVQLYGKAGGDRYVINRCACALGMEQRLYIKKGIMKKLSLSADAACDELERFERQYEALGATDSGVCVTTQGRLKE